MPNGPRGEKRPADAIGRAVQVAKIATRDLEDTGYEHPKKALSGKKGGIGRAESLSSNRRSQIGKKGAKARWQK